MEKRGGSFHIKKDVFLFCFVFTLKHLKARGSLIRKKKESSQKQLRIVAITLETNHSG